MIWVVRQFITNKTLEMGSEKVRFPIRVEVEYQQEGTYFLPGSLHKKVLYNKEFLLRHSPDLKERDLDLLVEEVVQKAIHDHLIVPEGGD
jgi:hypothetical protein